MSFNLRRDYRDGDIEHIEMFLGQLPVYMHLPGPRLQLIDVFVRDNHRGGTVAVSIPGGTG